MSNRRSVQSGSCMEGGDGSLCAFQARDCPQNTNWVAARLLPTGNAHGGHCRQKASTESISPLGLCARAECASDASMCGTKTLFTPATHDNGCNLKTREGSTKLVEDQSKETEETTAPAQFGWCAADNSCYWSQDDCTESETWHLPNDIPDDMTCPCDKVKVGACLYQGYYWCAVSDDACAPGDEWISAPAMTVLRSGNKNGDDVPQCFLCREPSVPVPASLPNPTASPTERAVSTNQVLSETEAPQQPLEHIPSPSSLSSSFFASNTSPTDSSNTTVIVVLAVVGSVTGVALLLGLFWHLRKYSANKVEESPSPYKYKGPPTGSTDQCTPIYVEASEPLSDDDDEGVNFN